MADTERLFDDLLNDATDGTRTPAECVSLLEQSHPELVEMLEIALNLRACAPDEAELASARANISRNVESLLDLVEQVHMRSSGAPAPQLFHARRTRPRWVKVVLCAAMLMLALVGYAALSNAAIGSLPESPLYTLKRVDENLQLTLALTDQMRGQILARIAMQRLNEARAEAELHNTHQAMLLMNQSNAATQQLIDLVVRLHRQHQDDASVTNALTMTLQNEYTAMAQTSSNGQAWLAQALGTTLRNQQGTLAAGDITLPPQTIPAMTTPTETTPTTAAQPTPTPGSTPEAHPTPIPHSKVPPQPTPGSNNAGGKGNGNNGGGSTGGSGGSGGNGGSGGSGGGSGHHGHGGHSTDKSGAMSHLAPIIAPGNSKMCSHAAKFHCHPSYIPAR